jgi:hypothetical protein
MPFYNSGHYWRPIQAGAKDLAETRRPLLCFFGIHRPHRVVWYGKSRMCSRCPYWWLV